MSRKSKTKRMDKPDDTLFKRQAAYAGDVIHVYHKFPGMYLRPTVNEYPNVGGGVPRTDSSYHIYYKGKECVINWEEESSPVDLDALQKCNNYRINLEYTFKQPVISVITTLAPLEKCKTQYEASPTLQFSPIIRLYADCDGEQRLNKIKSKIKNSVVLSKVEAMDLIMIPKMFTSNQDIVLEEVVGLLPLALIEDEDFKLELIFEMQCVIHKYAKTLKDINRLEEVIGLQKAMTAMEFQKMKFEEECVNRGITQGITQGIDQGIVQGRNQGAFLMALKVKKALGIDKAVEISGFSREELENEELNE